MRIKSVGANDVYKNNKCKIDKILYRKIIDTINKKLIEELFRKNKVRLPVGLGDLVITKTEISPTIKDGQLIIYNSINWAETNKYWKEHPDEKKFLIRHTNTTIYRIKLYKTTRYRNSIAITFNPSSPLRRELAKKIITENYDTIYEKDYKYKTSDG